MTRIKTWAVVAVDGAGNYSAWNQAGANRAHALQQATRRALGDDASGRIVSFTYGAMRAHVGIGGYGYCTACGLKPSSTRYTAHCAGEWSA